MNCPKDNTPLETHSLGEVQVDECPTCRGAWFDAGELEQAKNTADPDLGWMEFDLWRDQERYSLSLSERQCPRDGQPMVAILYGKPAQPAGESGGVTVDHCVKCGGVWLDAGEFGRIVAALEAELVSQSSGEYVKDSLQEAGELLSGKKSFAREWRDFKTVLRLMQYRILSENPKLRDALIAYARSTPFK
jgi:Zn-finger nucleic acid-binding protein